MSNNINQWFSYRIFEFVQEPEGGWVMAPGINDWLAEHVTKYDEMEAFSANGDSVGFGVYIHDPDEAIHFKMVWVL